MHFNRRFILFEILALVLILALTGLHSRLKADTGTCGGATTTLPFNDVSSSAFFCQIAAAYFSGLSNGTSATTYSPGNVVTREQMAAFVTRTQDGALKRGSRRAALDQWWTGRDAWSAYEYTFGNSAMQVKSDGFNVYVSDASRIYSTSLVDGTHREWTGLTNATGLLCQGGYVWATGRTAPGRLYRISPLATAANEVSLSLGNNPEHLAYDGKFIWTANFGNPGNGSVSQFDPIVGIINFTTEFDGNVTGITYDGANMWLTVNGGILGDRLLKLDASANVVAQIRFLAGPRNPLFDGTNIWVPNFSGDSVTVVRAATATVLATLTGNGLHNPNAAAFDGERVLVTNQSLGSPIGRVSLWKATDLIPLGTPAVVPSVRRYHFPYAVCNDSISFWILAADSGAPLSVLMRF